MGHIEDELVKRIHRDLQDDFGEELELELEDRDFAAMPSDQPADAAAERKRYFRELFRLQSELVKLQEAPAPRGLHPQPGAREPHRDRGVLSRV